jgi:hypothetical protein
VGGGSEAPQGQAAVKPRSFALGKAKGKKIRRKNQGASSDALKMSIFINRLWVHNSQKTNHKRDT